MDTLIHALAQHNTAATFRANIEKRIAWDVIYWQKGPSCLRISSAKRESVCYVMHSQGEDFQIETFDGQEGRIVSESDFIPTVLGLFKTD